MGWLGSAATRERCFVTLAGRYNSGLYDAGDIAAASFTWRGSAHLFLIERELGVPRYAPRETASDVLAKTDQTRVPRSAVKSYLLSIRDIAESEDGSEHDMSLVAAMRAVGGHLKFWRQVLSAVVSCDLPVDLRTGSGALAHCLVVMPEEIAPFRRLLSTTACRLNTAAPCSCRRWTP